MIADALLFYARGFHLEDTPDAVAVAKPHVADDAGRTAVEAFEALGFEIINAALDRASAAAAENFDEERGLPKNNRDQSCAFCGSPRPRFVHPLDPVHIAFRAWNKGWTLPTFWTVSAECEGSVTAGDDAELLRRMSGRGEDEELSRASLAAFRAADLGAQPLPDG